MMEILQERTATEPPVPPHILVMEDEFSVAKGLEIVLTEEGYVVDLAMTGQSALDKSNAKLFDLLVADLRLPDIDGMEVVRQVKKKRPQTEAIVITGYPSVSSAVESVKIGVYDYLRKPFTDDQFMEAVEGALKRKEEASIEEVIAETEKGRLIQKQEVIRVLDRTAQDVNFWRALMETGSKALEGYQLSAEAKAAIVRGDLIWIKDHVGELTREQLMFIYKRLEREAW
jgi:DNA-binding NtrC family response regulator